MDREPPSLHGYAGGSAGLHRLIECFYDRVERDELLSPLFPGGVGGEHRRLGITAPVPRWGCGEAPPYDPGPEPG